MHQNESNAGSNTVFFLGGTRFGSSNGGISFSDALKITPVRAENCITAFTDGVTARFTRRNGQGLWDVLHSRETLTSANVVFKRPIYALYETLNADTKAMLSCFSDAFSESTNL